MTIMKPKRILLFLFIISVFISANGNTRSHCEDLLKLAEKESLNENYAIALKALGEVKTIALNNHWNDLLSSALNNEGTIYMDILNYQKAMDCFLESYKIAIKESAQTQEVSILNNIAQIYFIKGDVDKAKKYLDNAYHVAEKLKDSIKTGIIALNIGTVLNEMENFTQAERYLDIAISLSTKTRDSLTLISAQLIKAKSLYYKTEYEKAEQLAKQVLVFGDKEQIAQSMLLLAQIQEQVGNLDNAIQYAQNALNEDVNLTTKIELYQYLSKLYLHGNLLVYALAYQDSLLIAKDSLSKIRDLAQITNNQIEFDLINSEKELINNIAKQKSTRILFISLLVFFCVLVVVTLWMLQIQSIKNKQRKIIIELELEKEKNEKLILQRQIVERETITLLEQERLINQKNEKILLDIQLKKQADSNLSKQEPLHSEIDNSKETTSKALFQSHRNELIKEIIDKLSQTSDNLKKSTLESVIPQLQTLLKESNEWEGFFLYFEKTNPAFLSSLKEKHPDLNAGEIRFLSYLYLNLNNAEIANLLSVTEGHCRKKKLQIATKIGIPATELYHYLTTEIEK